MSATSSETSSAASTAVDSKQRLEKFLRELKPYREEAIRSSQRVNAAIDQYNSTSKTPATLSALGDTFDAEADEFSRTVDGMAHITPPATLKDEYLKYMTYRLVIASKLAAMADDAHAGISAVATREELEQLDTTTAATFKLALIQRLSANGVNVPNWVKQISG